MTRRSGPLWVTSRNITSDLLNGCYAEWSSPSVCYLATVSERPGAVIEEGQRNDLLDSILKKSRLQSKDDLAQHHNRYEKDAEHLVEPFSL